jgi:hypothetical protein
MAKFGAIVTALQTATGSHLVGRIDGTTESDAIEDEIQESLDLIEDKNPDKNDPSRS